MQKIERRKFIALATAFAGSLKAREKPAYSFPTQPRERLAVSTYPFRSFIASPHRNNTEGESGRMLLEEFAAILPQKLSVRGIEPWSPHFQSTDADYVHALHGAFRKAGLRVVNIPVDVVTHLCGSAQDRQAGLEIYRKWVDAAVILGSPGIRIHLPRGESGEQISCAVSSLSELARYGAEKNVVINLENDEPDTEQPERIARVIQSVNSPFLCALPDFCNSMLIHDDPEYNDRAMALLFPLAFNISHVKDEESGDGKIYRVDVNRIFSIARKAGYHGFFSMEWEGTGDPWEGTKRLLNASLRNLS